MCYLDRRFPGKIFGLQLNGMETGGAHAIVARATIICVTETLNVVLNVTEWFGSGMGGHSDPTFFGDYSNATRDEWGSAPPTAALRDTPTIGNTLVVGSGPTGVPEFNRWFAKRTVKALATLAQAAKDISGGKAFTAFYYGYLYELAGNRLAGSGHLAISELMTEPAIDGVLSPYHLRDRILAIVIDWTDLSRYTYAAEGRNFTMPLVPHGVIDSAWLHGKLHVIEDDSRFFCWPDDKHW